MLTSMYMGYHVGEHYVQQEDLLGIMEYTSQLDTMMAMHR